MIADGVDHAQHQKQGWVSEAAALGLGCINGNAGKLDVFLDHGDRKLAKILMNRHDLSIVVYQRASANRPRPENWASRSVPAVLSPSAVSRSPRVLPLSSPAPISRPD